MARAKLDAPRFVAGALRDEAVGSLPGPQRRDLRGEVLPAKGPARAPWPKLRLQVCSSTLQSLCYLKRPAKQLHSSLLELKEPSESC